MSSARGRQTPTLHQSLLNKAAALVQAAGGSDESRAVTAVCMALYWLTGVAQPMLMSEVRFAGMGNTSCQLYMLPYYVGMTCAGLLAAWLPGPKWRTLPLYRSAGIALLGLIGQSLNQSGNILAGSGIHAVVYSSGSVWVAVLSRFTINRVLTGRQWLGIIIVFVGLAITGLNAKVLGSNVFLGACLIGMGALMHAGSHVCTEMISVRGERIPAHINCCVQGLTCVTIVSMWQCFYTLPHWETCVTKPMEEAGASGSRGASLLICVGLGNCIHAGSFFYLLTRIGAVSTGIIKAMQAVTVFILSHFVYCSRDEAQCFTPIKGISLVVVVSGVLSYVLATTNSHKR